MVKKTVLAAALAFGCDDPEVSGKVESLLLHGAVEASIRCESEYSYIGYGGSPIPYVYKADRFVDGSIMVQLLSANHFKFWNRNDAEAEDAVVTYGNGPSELVFEAHDGNLTAFCPGCTSPTDVADVDSIDVACTGFNLAAFGVE